jgi:hypothetical protein
MAKGFKTGGRQAGTPNRINAEIRDHLANYLRGEIAHITTHLDELTMVERARLFTAICRLTLPPLEREQTTFEEPPVIVIHGNL